MKSYKHLTEQLTTDENILLAIRNATRGKRKLKKWKDLYENRTKRVKEFCNVIYFKNAPHKPKEIYDGITRKKRTIVVPSMREQVVHHMVVQILKPIFMHGMYEHAYGSLPDRGAHGAKKRMEKWVRDDKNNKYVLKLDIHKYFESIPHDRLKAKLAKVIRDRTFLNILFEIIDVNDVGLPLGFYTSQWLAMWYLKDFDHFVKEKLHIKYYMRYMDDMVLLGSNKKELAKALDSIKAFLNAEGLELNPKSQLFRFNKNGHGRDIDYMGFRFFRNRTILRRNIYYKMCRKAKRISKKAKATVYEIRQMMSYLGWIKSADVYAAWLSRIKPFFCVRKARKRISRYDKRKE